MSSPGPSTPPSPPTPKGKKISGPSGMGDDMADLNWSCRCTNISVKGSVSKQDHKRLTDANGSTSQDVLRVWVGSKAEQVVSCLVAETSVLHALARQVASPLAMGFY